MLKLYLDLCTIMVVYITLEETMFSKIQVRLSIISFNSTTLRKSYRPNATQPEGPHKPEGPMFPEDPTIPEGPITPVGPTTPGEGLGGKRAAAASTCRSASACLARFAKNSSSPGTCGKTAWGAGAGAANAVARTPKTTNILNICNGLIREMYVRAHNTICLNKRLNDFIYVIK